MKINEIINISDNLQCGLYSGEIVIYQFNRIIFCLPKNIIHKCSGCGNCCKTNKIALITVDIEMINKCLKNHHSLSKFYNNFFIRVDPEPDSPSRFCMKKIPIEEKDYLYYDDMIFRDKCLFLSKSNKCLIHNFKPLLCRLYPFRAFPINLSDTTIRYGFMAQVDKKREKYVCNGFFKGNYLMKDLKKIVIIINSELKAFKSELKTLYLEQSGITYEDILNNKKEKFNILKRNGSDKK